jgi:hypothetical protein
VGKKQDAACQAYTIVQKECFARQSPYYQNTGCPTINDMTRITQVQKALERGEPAPALPGSSSSAAEQATAGGVTLKDLQPSERMAVRRAIQVKNCSKKLPQAMYLICSAVVGEDQQAAPMGLTNDLAKIREERATKRATTLKERIEMTEPVQR